MPQSVYSPPQPGQWREVPTSGLHFNTLGMPAGDDRQVFPLGKPLPPGDSLVRFVCFARLRGNMGSDRLPLVNPRTALLLGFAADEADVSFTQPYGSATPYGVAVRNERPLIYLASQAYAVGTLVTPLVQQNLYCQVQTEQPVNLIAVLVRDGLNAGEEFWISDLRIWFERLVAF